MDNCEHVTCYREWFASSDPVALALSLPTWLSSGSSQLVLAQNLWPMQAWCRGFLQRIGSWYMSRGMFQGLIFFLVSIGFIVLIAVLCRKKYQNSCKWTWRSIRGSVGMIGAVGRRTPSQLRSLLCTPIHYYLIFSGRAQLSYVQIRCLKDLGSV